jgi:hypothetical protein
MTQVGKNSLDTRSSMTVGGKTYAYYSLAKAAEKIGDVSRLPFSMKVLLENLLRFEDAGFTVSVGDIQAIADWQKDPVTGKEIQYRPARVLMQDFTGVPCVVDLAAMRDAIAKLGGDTRKINPLVPVHLVIDHSVMVDEFGHPRRSRRTSRSSTSATSSATTSSSGARRASTTSRRCPRAPASATRSTSSTSPSACGPARTRTADWSPIPTPASAPTATRR